MDAFTYLFHKLAILFGEVNFTRLKNACVLRGTELPQEFKQQMKAAQELDDLLDVLDNPMYCNWLNIRLLKRIARNMDISEAEQLIQAYEQCIYSRKVSDVVGCFKSIYFDPDHVALVKAKINQNIEILTVERIVKYCKFLESDMKIAPDFVTATDVKPGCLEITCFIPFHCSLLAYKTAESFPKVFAINCSSDQKRLHELKSSALMCKLPSIIMCVNIQ